MRKQVVKEPSWDKTRPTCDNKLKHKNQEKKKWCAKTKVMIKATY